MLETLAETRRCASARTGHAVAVRGADLSGGSVSTDRSWFGSTTTSGRQAPSARTPSSGSSAREAAEGPRSALTRTLSAVDGLSAGDRLRTLDLLLRRVTGAARPNRRLLFPRTRAKPARGEPASSPSQRR